MSGHAKSECGAKVPVISRVIHEPREQHKPKSIRIDNYASSEMEQSTESRENHSSSSRETTPMVSGSHNNQTSASRDHVDEAFFSGNPSVEITKGDMYKKKFCGVESAMEFCETYNGCTQLETNLSRLPIERDGDGINELKDEVRALMFNLKAQNNTSNSDSKDEIALSSPHSMLRLRGGAHSPFNFSSESIESRWSSFNDAQQRAFRIREELGDAQDRHIGRELFETLSIEAQAAWTLQTLEYIIAVKDVGGEQKRWLGMTFATFFETISVMCAMAFVPLAYYMESNQLFSWLMVLLILISFSVHTATRCSPRFKSFVRKFGSNTGFWWKMITVAACIFLRFGTKKFW